MKPSFTTKLKPLYSKIAFIFISINVLLFNISNAQVIPAQSQFLYADDFNYTAATLLSANGWTAFSSAGTNAIPISSPGLTYPGIPATGIGNCVSLLTSGEDAYNGTAYTTQTESLTGTSIYASFMINVSAAQATGDYFFSFYNTSGTAAFSGGRIFIKSSGTGFVMAVGKTATAGAYTTTTLTFGQTYFIVVKHLMTGAATGPTAGTDDISTFWINPALGLTTEPAFDGQDAAGTDPNSSGIARTNRVALRQGSSTQAPTLRVDGIRVGTTWQSVTSLSVGAITPTAYVPGDAITIPVVTYGTYVTGNNFTAFLSDASGSFAAETTLTPSLSSTTSNNIITAIPGAAVPGTNYKIRIKSSNPAVVGAESAPFTVLAALVNYYYKGTGNIADVANWSTNTSGTGGTQPANFTSSGQVFNIRNCTALSTSAPWTVDGAGSKIVLNDNAAAPITLTITNGNDITTVISGVFEIAGIGNTIVYQNINPLSLSTIVDPSTNLIFDGASCVLSSATNRTFNSLNVINGATATFTGIPTFSSISVDASSTLGTNNASTNYIIINGNVIINGKFRTLKVAGMFNGLSGSTGGALQPTGTLTIGPASTIEFARGNTGNTATQTIDARTDYFNVIISNSGVASSKVFAVGPTTIAGTLTMNTLVSGAVGTATLSGTTTVNGGLVLTNGNIISTTANMLTLGSAATVTGGSNVSFVSGPITKNTNSTNAFILPLGKASAYKPATITPISASAGIYVGEYFNVGQGTTTFTAPLDNISTSEYWDIARTSGPDITLSLQYAPTTWLNTAPDNSKNIGIAHLVTGSWIKETAVAIAGDATSGTLISTVLTSFSPFTYAAAPLGTLPLSLIEFSANKSTNGIQLRWKINEDNSISKYEVEKSYDTRNFVSFETVKATSQLGEKNYSSFDGNITAGVIYYRLKMIAHTGSIKYSNIIKIETNGKTGITIYPNPITNNTLAIQMYKQTKGNYSVGLYSLDGKLVEQIQFNHNGNDGTRTMALKSNVTTGNYFVVIKNGNTTIGSYPALIK